MQVVPLSLFSFWASIAAGGSYPMLIPKERPNLAQANGP